MFLKMCKKIYHNDYSFGIIIIVAMRVDGNRPLGLCQGWIFENQCLFSFHLSVQFCSVGIEAYTPLYRYVNSQYLGCIFSRSRMAFYGNWSEFRFFSFEFHSSHTKNTTSEILDWQIVWRFNSPVTVQKNADISFAVFWFVAFFAVGVRFWARSVI